eukprot:NODE_9_length_47730_cov_0.323718.p30 type:complete len:124 gc:universal NODE_9_length_47730_cov_0.323718:13140-12769(-)
MHMHSTTFCTSIGGLLKDLSSVISLALMLLSAFFALSRIGYDCFSPISKNSFSLSILSLLSFISFSFKEASFFLSSMSFVFCPTSIRSPVKFCDSINACCCIPCSHVDLSFKFNRQPSSLDNI